MAARVGILLPVFDAAATLPACLESIRRQRFADFECVIVDDGSRDGSLARARRTASRDPRFVVLRRPHRGIVAALEAGLAHAGHEILARMDADDLMHRERLAAQIAALDADPDLAAVGCGVRMFPRAGLSPGMRAYERWLASIDSPERVQRESFVECPVAHPTLVIRGDLLRRLRYRERSWPEDYDLLLRLLEGGQRVGMVSRRLHLWRRDGANLSLRSSVYAPERFTACKAEFLARGLLAGSARYLLWGYGGTGRALRRALLRSGKCPAGIVEMHPRRLGNRIHGAPVVPPQEIPKLPRLPLVVSVAGSEARTRIRDFLAALGWRELQDFICAA